jgi:hypothetical protein
MIKGSKIIGIGFCGGWYGYYLAKQPFAICSLIYFGLMYFAFFLPLLGLKKLYLTLLLITSYFSFGEVLVNDSIFLLVSPVIVYSKLEMDKDQILSDNRGKAGIYRFVNEISGSTYIGSAVDLRIRLRNYFSVGYLKRQTSRSKSKIYSSLLKNGYENFSGSARNLKVLFSIYVYFLGGLLFGPFKARL